MEVKVSVDGISRVVCGVTKETTCHEVVIALAQALGQPGRYTLREKFKYFERCMAPNERLLETLEKYGEQAREVQLTLLHTGPLWDQMSRTNMGRYKPCPPLRRKDPGSRMWRGSGSLGLHRRSLPPLSSLRQEPELQKEDPKRPNRKSLTLMEEAWEWLESLGKGKVYSTSCDKDSSKKIEKKNRSSLDLSLIVDKDFLGQNGRSRARGQKGFNSDMDHQTSCCMGSQTRGKGSKHFKKCQKATSDDLPSSKCATTEDEKNSLRETIIHQLSCLQDLQVLIVGLDQEIFELEQRQKVNTAKREAQQGTAEEEMEQVKFWEIELKAEEGYEKDLQCQFLEMRTKAVECKAKLEEYKCKMQGLDFFAAQNVMQEDSEVVLEVGANTPTEISAGSTEGQNGGQSDPEGDVSMERKYPPRGHLNPHTLVPPSQIKERRPTGPTELREWWTRWSEAQSSPLQTKKKVIHRSELTIYLGSTKV